MSNNYELHVSWDNSKLGPIPAIDLPAKTTCRPGALCAEKCYACKGCYTWPKKKQNMLENLRLFISDPARFEASIIQAVSLSRFCRWHSSGDIPTPAYLELMCRVARKCPGTKFLAFTKRFEFINDYLASGKTFPKNLHIVFSRWPGDALYANNPYKLPEAYMKEKQNESGWGIRWDAKKCTGNCAECCRNRTGCWYLKPGKAVYFDEH